MKITNHICINNEVQLIQENIEIYTSSIFTKIIQIIYYKKHDLLNLLLLLLILLLVIIFSPLNM